MQDYWHKQTADRPLFPDLLWSRPETKRQAGKLLVVGGNAHGFAAPAEAYNQALEAGIGTARVLLPDSLQKTVFQLFPEAEFAPSTPSGSFGKPALAELLSLATWADGVLLAGDLGRNSETAVVLEEFAKEYHGQLTLTGDSIDYFNSQPLSLLERANTCLVPSFAQLQKLATAVRFPTALASGIDFLRFMEVMHEFTHRYPAPVVAEHLETVFVAVKGLISTTKPMSADTNPTKLAAHAAVWWLQNPDKPFEALTSSLVEV